MYGLEHTAGIDPRKASKATSHRMTPAETDWREPSSHFRNGIKGHGKSWRLILERNGAVPETGWEKHDLPGTWSDDAPQTQIKSPPHRRLTELDERSAAVNRPA